jgi:hypothetical protein
MKRTGHAEAALADGQIGAPKDRLHLHGDEVANGS